MKLWTRILVSIAVGSLVTALFGFIAQIPSNGPRTITLIFELPFILIATALEKAIGVTLPDFVFFGIQVAFYAAITFVFLLLFRKVKPKS